MKDKYVDGKATINGEKPKTIHFPVSCGLEERERGLNRPLESTVKPTSIRDAKLPTKSAVFRPENLGFF